jgi:hypothetical protein
MPRHGKYPDERRERVVRMVLDHGHEYGSQPSRDYHLKQLSDAEKAIVEQQGTGLRSARRPLATQETRRQTVDDFIVVSTTALSSTGNSRDGTNSPPGLFPGVDHGRVASRQASANSPKKPASAASRVGAVKISRSSRQIRPSASWPCNATTIAQVHETQLDLGVGPGGQDGIGQALRPSQHTMKVSCTPRLGSSVNKLIQNLTSSPAGWSHPQTTGTTSYQSAGPALPGGP